MSWPESLVHGDRSALAGAEFGRKGVEPGQAEVGDLGTAVAGEQHVGRLQVAVGDPVLVGGMDGAGQGLDEPGGGAAAGVARRRCRGAAVEELQQEDGRPSCSPSSWIWTILGCCNRARADASARRRAAKLLSPLVWIILSATCGPAPTAAPDRPRPCRRAPGIPGPRSRESPATALPPPRAGLPTPPLPGRDQAAKSGTSRPPQADPASGGKVCFNWSMKASLGSRLECDGWVEPASLSFPAPIGLAVDPARRRTAGSFHHRGPASTARKPCWHRPHCWTWTDTACSSLPSSPSASNRSSCSRSGQGSMGVIRLRVSPLLLGSSSAHGSWP